MDIPGHLRMTYSRTDRHLILRRILCGTIQDIHIILNVTHPYHGKRMAFPFLYAPEFPKIDPFKFGFAISVIIYVSVNSQDQLQDDLTKIARARDEMARAIGSIDTFIYGSLREKPAIGARSGTSKPEQIKE